MMLDRVFAYCEKCQLLSSRILENLNQDLDSFSGVSLLSTPRIGVFFSLKGVARQQCRALRIRVGQMGELALSQMACTKSKHLVLRTYTFLSFFSYYLQ